MRALHCTGFHWWPVALMAADLLGWLGQAARVSEGRRSTRKRIPLFNSPQETLVLHSSEGRIAFYLPQTRLSRALKMFIRLPPAEQEHPQHGDDAVMASYIGTEVGLAGPGLVRAEAGGGTGLVGKGKPRRSEAGPGLGRSQAAARDWWGRPAPGSDRGRLTWDWDLRRGVPPWSCLVSLAMLRLLRVSSHHPGAQPQTLAALLCAGL